MVHRNTSTHQKRLFSIKVKSLYGLYEVMQAYREPPQYWLLKVIWMWWLWLNMVSIMRLRLLEPRQQTITYANAVPTNRHYRLLLRW